MLIVQSMLVLFHKVLIIIIIYFHKAVTMIGPSLPPLACCVGLLSLLAVAGTDALPADQYDHEVSLLDQLLKNLERRKKVSSGSSDDVSIQDIVDSLDRRSQLTSDSLPRTLQEVLDSLSTRVEKRGQDDNDTGIYRTLSQGLIPLF